MTRHPWSRPIIVILSLIALAVPPFFSHEFERFDKIYAVIGAVLTTVAGIFHLRELSENPRYRSDAYRFTVIWRNLIASDRLVALYLLSVAVVATSVSVYLSP